MASVGSVDGNHTTYGSGGRELRGRGWGLEGRLTGIKGLQGVLGLLALGYVWCGRCRSVVEKKNTGRLIGCCMAGI